MNYSLIEWIDSAKKSTKGLQRNIRWINSQGGVNAAIARAEKNGTRPILTPTHLILIHGERLTIRINDASAMVVQGREVTFRNHTPPEKAVKRISSANSRPLNAFRLKIGKPKYPK